MAGSAKHKVVVQKEMYRSEKTVEVLQTTDCYRQYLSWRFSSGDLESWAFSESEIGDCFWNEIFPYLKNLEMRTWGDILVSASKQNHSIAVSSLNKMAIKRLEARKLEPESIVSLRVNGTHRLYGYLVGPAFNILWYDTNHGDNETCVCRSRKKHT